MSKGLGAEGVSEAGGDKAKIYEKQATGLGRTSEPLLLTRDRLWVGPFSSLQAWKIRRRQG